MAQIIEKAYEAKKYEDRIYRTWEKSGLFTPKIIKRKKPFTIIMPPPNATGTLHLGHATMLAVEDIMVRWQRMNGVPTLWLPGTDHAGIATQNKVEKILLEEGKTRQNMGREKFLEKINAFVKESRSTIRTQIRKMGASCDWTRERYTLDKGLSVAVGEVFVRMYNDGLVYRGARIVNWCARCSSTLADDEVVFKEEKTKFYYLRYGPVIIGTARPETKFLDKVIAVHPDDGRYKKYIGKRLKVPWIDSEVEAMFIADKRVDPDFGSGAMTLTPAHDFLDFDIAKKHNLDIIQIIGPDGNFTEAAGIRFAGKNARKSRGEIIKILEKKDLLERVEENYVHNLSICYRCDTPIEPLVSKQWFIDVNKPVIKDKNQVRANGKRKEKLKSLKQKASEVVRNGQIEIIPKRFHKIYFHWLDNLRDWCISRQIWFGHQIPVWYCMGGEKCPLDCSQPIVQVEAPLRCPRCGSKKLKRDTDTLDTWFSSGLWTFSTLGWPQKTRDLAYFHPTSVLETGHDILFFWIARMILMTVYALHDIPFKKVYLHGLVRDRQGIKMSKSAGNGIDPLDMIEKYGTDSVRLSLVIGTAAGMDFRLYEEKIAGYRNFVNKIWNGARFALFNVSSDVYHQPFLTKYIKTSADRWILSKLQKLIKAVTKDLENDYFSEAGTKIYTFYWSFFCDWYIELSKSSVNSSGKGIKRNLHVLIFVLKTLLKLLHPFVPFVTEALWNHMEQKSLIMAEKWPEYNKKLIFPIEEKNLQIVMDVISAVRGIRAERNIEPSRKIHAIFYGGKYSDLLEAKREPIMRMAKLEKLEIKKTGRKITGALWKYLDGVHIYLPLKDLFDLVSEQKRLKQKLDETSKKIQVLELRLDNVHFLEKAPEAIVLKEKELFRALKQELRILEEKMSELEGAG